METDDIVNKMLKDLKTDYDLWAELLESKSADQLLALKTALMYEIDRQIVAVIPTQVPKE